MLKSLELFGFKSFADRTKFDFAPGITGVVGPNGSGKSNVVDSIKWILGDQSPKSLRGKEMTDVIFNGSASRKAAGLAEATLHFDNRQRVFNLDADEVLVGRRIYRSGEAEYLINRVPARLKDIRDLFLGTGAGASAYSIIEQGRVDQLLQATNIARRAVFEEAAGISRFKLKKVEAQRKLERIDQNLLRLTDIVNEVEAQLSAVRGQAQKASRYRDLTHELRTLRLGLAADDYRALTSQQAAVAADHAALQSQLDQAAAAATNVESWQKAAESRLAEVEDRLRAAERRAAENREAVAGHEATLRHLQTRLQELDADYLRLERQQEELAARATAISGELEATVDSLERFSGEFTARKQSLQQQEEAIATLADAIDRERAAVEQCRDLLLDAVRAASIEENRATAVRSQIESLQATRRKAVARFQSLRAQCDAATAQLETLRQHSAAAEAALEQSRTRWSDLQNLRQQRVDQQAELRQHLFDCREQRSAVQARKTVLEDLERRQEGLGVGVKEILARARDEQRLPWTTVRGHVVDLLEVDLENAALLEVALGNRAQLIVLDDAAPILHFLQEEDRAIAGRVGFLALPSRPDALTFPLATAAPLPDLRAERGVVGPAADLARPAPHTPELAVRLLADTWIVHSLDDALRLARGPGAGCRFVTLQGELLDRDGVLFVGSVRSESALLSRRSELRGIRADLQRIDRQLADDEHALNALLAETATLDTAAEQLRHELDSLAQDWSEARAAAAAHERELERLLRDRADVEAELARADIELEQLAANADTAESLRRAALVRQHELQAEVTAGEHRLADLEHRHLELRREHATEQLHLAQQEERLRNLQNARSRLDQERFQRDLHREEAQHRFEQLATKRAQIDDEIRQTTAVLDRLEASRGVLSAEVDHIHAQRDAAREERSRVADQELRQRHQLRDLKDQLHALAMRASELGHQLTHMVDRLRDEYQIELQELVASDLSARQAWLSLESPPATPPDEHPPHEPATAPSEHPRAPLPPPPADDSALRQAVEERIQSCRRKLKAVGHVNADSLKELDDLDTRYTRLSTQLQDLIEAKTALEEIIRRLNTESRRLFTDTFSRIREHFQELFRKLFGGGEGDVVLEDPNDVLECGIDIVARPPGKELRSLSLLSGGEKTMTAVALLLAIFKTRPSPFCILDEVDAALDEGNVERYMGVIREFQQWTQFVVITHNKRTMGAADVLYGVTMEEAGVSKRMSVRFDDIGEDGSFRANSASSAA